MTAERDLIAIGFTPHGDGSLHTPGRITLTRDTRASNACGGTMAPRLALDARDGLSAIKGRPLGWRILMTRRRATERRSERPPTVMSPYANSGRTPVSRPRETALDA